MEAMLRRSPAFQRFLDDRARYGQTIPLEEMETGLEKDLAGTERSIFNTEGGGDFDVSRRKQGNRPTLL